MKEITVKLTIDQWELADVVSDLNNPKVWASDVFNKYENIILELVYEVEQQGRNQ